MSHGLSAANSSAFPPAPASAPKTITALGGVRPAPSVSEEVLHGAEQVRAEPPVNRLYGDEAAPGEESRKVQRVGAKAPTDDVETEPEPAARVITHQTHRPEPGLESKRRCRRRSARLAMRPGRNPSARKTGMATRLPRITQFVTLTACEVKNLSATGSEMPGLSACAPQERAAGVVTQSSSTERYRRHGDPSRRQEQAHGHAPNGDYSHPHDRD